jgi:RNA polymerase sigma-70 factor (ECF subfamily)
VAKILSKSGVSTAAAAHSASKSPTLAPSDALAQQKAARDQEDEKWLRAYQQGDVSGFENLLKRHRSGVFTFCLKMLGHNSAAEDALQEIFLRVVKAAPKWKRQAKVRTWIYTIARNHCIDALRKARHRKTASLDQPLRDDEKDGASLGEQIADENAMAPDRGAAHTVLRKTLVEALGSLSEEQREVFVMREYAGLPFKEIASVVGVSENTVKSRMRYALEHMRNHLQKAGISPRGSDGGS